MEATFKQLLVDIDACEDARIWSGDYSFQDAYEKCNRGDWLLWLFYKTMENTETNRRRITLAKGHCAAMYLYLMKDARSKNAVDIAIKYGNNVCDLDDLINARTLAFEVYRSHNNRIPFAMQDDHYLVSTAYYAAIAAVTPDYSHSDSFGSNHKSAAAIVKTYLPIHYWNIQTTK